MVDVLLFLVGAAGMALHWLKRWSVGQTEAGFWHYYFVNETRRSLGAVATMLVAVATFVSTWDGELTKGVLYTVLLSGYAADSAVNEG